MNFDLGLFQELMLVGNRYLAQAKDRGFLARKMADHWKGLAEGEERMKPRSKSGSHFAAAVRVFEEADRDEHRHTPVVPDPRKV